MRRWTVRESRTEEVDSEGGREGEREEVHVTSHPTHLPCSKGRIALCWISIMSEKPISSIALRVLSETTSAREANRRSPVPPSATPKTESRSADVSMQSRGRGGEEGEANPLTLRGRLSPICDI